MCTPALTDTMCSLATNPVLLVRVYACSVAEPKAFDATDTSHLEPDVRHPACIMIKLLHNCVAH
jgi:hypothetical protein